MKRLIGVCCLLLTVTKANAFPLAQLPPISIHLITVEGAHSLSHDQGELVANEALATLNNRVHLKLFIKSREKLKQDFTVGLSEADRFEELTTWQTREGSKDASNADYVIVIVPPVAIDDDLWGTAGYSIVCPTKYSEYRSFRVAVVNATDINPFGDSRLPHAVAAVQHELGHMLGSEHIENSENLMEPASLRFVDDFPMGELPINLETRYEWRDCLNLPRTAKIFKNRFTLIGYSSDFWGE